MEPPVAAAREDLFEVVHAQRACRDFGRDGVPDELVDRVLRAAIFAPSAENRQPWVFVVVTEAARRAQIGALTRSVWRGGARAYSEKRLSERLLTEVDAGAEGGVSDAPVLVVVCADTSLAHKGSLAASIFPAVQNLLLAATAVGLGSALTTLPTLAGDELRALIAAPPTIVPMAVVPLGWPARRLGPPRRASLDEKAHREQFGRPWKLGGGP